jgi:MYXO-CTERM domain-containing protein
VAMNRRAARQTPSSRWFGAVALTALTALAAACAEPPRPMKVRRAIVGGTEADVGAYPETVAIMDLSGHTGPSSYFCSGTLVGPRAVISAAHCMFDWRDRPVPANEIGVYFGHDAQSVPRDQVLTISTYFVPDTYPYGEVTDQTTGMGRDDDLSLLILDQPVTTVTPAPILAPAQVSTLTQGTMLLLVGFGMTTLDYSGPDGVMFYASSPIDIHSDYEILIGAPGQPDTCFGDSGGPAFLVQGDQRILVGITSRGTYDSTVDCGEGTINTLAPAYLQWVQDNLASVDGGVLGGGDATVPADAGSPGDGAAAPDGGVAGDGGEATGDAAASADGAATADGGADSGGKGGGCAVAGAADPTAPAGGAVLAALLLGAALVRPRRPRRTPPQGPRAPHRG